MTTPHQAADDLAEAIRGLFICEADLREHRDIPGRFDCAFCPAHDGKDDDGRWFNRRHPIHTRSPGSPMPCPWSTARDALTRYDAARAVPVPWSVERGGIGGPDAVWLRIGNQGFRVKCEPDPDYPGRPDWYAEQLTKAMSAALGGDHA